MAIAFVTQATGNNTAIGTSTCPVTISAPGTGNALVAFIVSRGTLHRTVSSFTHTNVTWQIYPSSSQSNGVLGFEMWYALNVPSNAGTSVTINFSGGAVSAANISEFSGIATSSATDGNAVGANHASGTTIATGSFTTTNASDLIITGVGNGNVTAPSVNPTGFNALTFKGSSGSVDVGVQGDYKIVSSTESDNPQWTLNSALAGASIGALTGAGAVAFTWQQLNGTEQPFPEPFSIISY